MPVRDGLGMGKYAGITLWIREVAKVGKTGVKIVFFCDHPTHDTNCLNVGILVPKLVSGRCSDLQHVVVCVVESVVV